MTHAQKVAVAIVAEQLESEGIPREDWEEIIYDELRDTPHRLTPREIVTALALYIRTRASMQASIRHRDSRQ